MRGLALLALAACSAQPEVPTTPRWVSLSPAITDTIVALGAADRLVAVSQHCSQPPGRELPRMGTLEALSAEALLRLKPSAVLTSTSRHASIDGLRKAGIKTLQFPEGSLDEILGNPTRVGEALGLAEAGVKLSETLRQQMAALKSRDATLLKALLIFATEGRPLRQVWAAGPGGWLGELAESVGLTNALTRGPSYAQLSIEGLIELAPELLVVITASPDGNESMRADLAALRALPGVKPEAVHALSGEALLRPGPRLIELAQGLAKLR